MNASQLISRIYASISFRLKWRFRLAIASIYRRKLARIPQSSLSRSKPLSQLRLMFMTGREQVDMLQLSARSVEQSWSAIPRLLLVSDGTISTDELREALFWWPHEVKAVTWQDLAEVATKRGRPELALLAERNVHSRKLSSLLEAALEGDTLMCDTDVLWFRGPPSFPENNGATVKLAEDIQAMYDDRLFVGQDRLLMSQRPWLNVGVGFATGDVYQAACLSEMVKAAANATHWFSEQTVLAYACRKLRGGSWPLSVIYLGIEDEIRWPGPSFIGQNWSARHYPGNVRHWFWVDAYHLNKACIPNEATI